MKTKKPLLPAVLVLALLAVGLILPSAAAADDQAVNWVANGENSNMTYHAGDWQGGHSVLVKEMPDGTLAGHAFLIGIKPTENRGVMRAVALLNYDPLTGIPIDVFRVEGDYKVAEFVLDFGPDTPLPFRYFKMILKDGGQPKTADLSWGLMGFGPPLNFWMPMSPTPLEPFSNIQIHMGE